MAKDYHYSDHFNYHTITYESILMTHEEQIRRGERAKQLLDDPLIKEALALIESEVIALWAAVPARDVEGREELWKFYKTAQKFKGVLLGAMDSGKLSVNQIQSKQSMPQRVANLVRGA